jgi:SpoIID/LytB domain protein
MGQFGASGYASLFGWTSAQILDHFYGNTTPGTVPGGTTMTVRLLAQDNRDLVVSSATAFTIAGVTIAGGRAGRLARTGGQWMLFTSNGCGQPEAAGITLTGGTAALSPEFVSTVADPSFFPDLMLGVCEGTARHHYRGTLRLAIDGIAQRTVNTLGLEDYIKGVVPQESPPAFPAAALEAQAVTARSFSMAENRFPYAKTCDTIDCQVYRGFSSGSTTFEAASTSMATTNTAGRVRMLGGSVARTEFSSSTGGFSAGGTFPAVVDDGDAVSTNPHHNWSTTLDATTVAATFGVGTLVGIEVTARNGLGADGGRALSVRVTGTTGAVTVTGIDFRFAFGLKSDWFTFGFVPPPLPTFYLRNSTDGGVATDTVFFGDGNGAPLLCDWNGDGVDTPASFNRGQWTLRNSLSGGPADAQFGFGQAGDVGVCGDWNGDGTDSPGVVRSGTWFLRNANSTGGADVTFGYGLGSDTPLVGDWNGDGVDTPAVFRNGTWFLRNTNSSGAGTTTFGYGLGTDRPVVGDWNGDGVDSFGVFRNGSWFLRNTLSTGVAEIPAFVFGVGADRSPLAADGDGNGTDGPALARNFLG